MAEASEDTITQSLECPVCQNTFTDPKILPCSHTYCKACLDKLLRCHSDDQMIRCPVCRSETALQIQDVDKLPENLALKNRIEAIKNQHKICRNCDSEDKPDAVVYCQDCCKHLCITCHDTHSQMNDCIDHEVIAMSEISSGKVSVHRYRKCTKHPEEDKKRFCSKCRRFTCFRCAVMEHTGEGHEVIQAAAYKSNHMKRVANLKSEVDKKQSLFQEYVDYIDEQEKRVSEAQQQCIDEINKAYEEALRKLTERRDILHALSGIQGMGLNE